jgi:hypothetical protein
MTVVERIQYYAKGVAAIIGGLLTFVSVIVSITKDGSLDGGDVSVGITALVTLVGTIIAVVKLRNVEDEA